MTVDLNFIINYVITPLLSILGMFIMYEFKNIKNDIKDQKDRLDKEVEALKNIQHEQEKNLLKEYPTKNDLVNMLLPLQKSIEDLREYIKESRKE